MLKKPNKTRFALPTSFTDTITSRERLHIREAFRGLPLKYPKIGSSYQILDSSRRTILRTVKETTVHEFVYGLVLKFPKPGLSTCSLDSCSRAGPRTVKVITVGKVFHSLAFIYPKTWTFNMFSGILFTSLTTDRQNGHGS